MAVIIRLKRMGSNKKPFFRIVATDSRRSNTGLFLEQLGWYDPKRKGVNFELSIDRFDYWKSKGAQVSDTVSSIAKKQRKIVPVVAPAAEAAAPQA